jgi:hypothetical protein
MSPVLGGSFGLLGSQSTRVSGRIIYLYREKYHISSLGIFLDFLSDRFKIQPYNETNFPRCTSFLVPYVES